MEKDDILKKIKDFDNNSNFLLSAKKHFNAYLIILMYIYISKNKIYISKICKITNFTFLTVFNNCNDLHKNKFIYFEKVNGKKYLFLTEKGENISNKLLDIYINILL